MPPEEPQKTTEAEPSETVPTNVNTPPDSAPTPEAATPLEAAAEPAVETLTPEPGPVLAEPVEPPQAEPAPPPPAPDPAPTVASPPVQPQPAPESPARPTEAPQPKQASTTPTESEAPQATQATPVSLSPAERVAQLTDEELRLAAALYAKKNQRVITQKAIEKRRAVATQNIANVTAYVHAHSPTSNAAVARALNLPPRRVAHYMQILVRNGTFGASGWGVSRRYFTKI